MVSTSQAGQPDDVAAQIAVLRRYRDDLPPHSEAGTRRALDERLASLEARRANSSTGR